MSKQTNKEDINKKLEETIDSYWDDKKKDKNPDFDGFREEEIKPAPKEKKPFNIKKLLLIILIIVVAFVAAIVITILAMEHIGKKDLLNSNSANTEITGADGAELENDGKIVVYNGKKYVYNESNISMLFMGVDREEFNEGSTYQEGGQADSLFLMVIDTSTGESKMVPISRYTMVPIDEYHEDGSYWRQNEIQVLLAYTYGDGREKSCENTTTAISRLLYGMPISGYVAIDLSGIGVLNDAIGGVTVEVMEDLTEADSELYLGNTVTLMGQQAETYVRSRKSEGTDLEVDNNAPRVERQVQYLNAFLSQTLSQMKTSPTLPLKLYNLAEDYTITDVSASETLYLMTTMASGGLESEVVTIPSTAKRGEYTEVYVDEDALYEVILDVFYTEVE
ncbi:LCP family protein [Eubacterium oxidoreducens]|uniref:Transcriptional attenuator, LytR family n=1 Tax=Eubacterium oxidoreducens TaxID=1732 RepID=A0A1G6BL59_EUBOX|nr:LCP family protein [Eubacterium oxidoreducens]SDB21348.1 transcriptional attenuator, LytR family [Eubacterium oxidoreducens]